MRKTTDPKRIKHLIAVHEAACDFYEQQIESHQERITFLVEYLASLRKPGFRPNGLNKIGKK